MRRFENDAELRDPSTCQRASRQTF